MAEIEAVSEQSQEADDSKRERSTIQFPYLPLDDAITIARGIHGLTGTSCLVDQLAGHLNQSPASSMFKLRLSTARIFGLITNAHGTLTLTALGTRICDEQQERQARADAFLAVPLYKQVYEQFKGASLPPSGALETTMVSMGVAAKQKSNARQVFHRSATQAGFFAFGPNRLVLPAIRSSAEASIMATETDSQQDREKPADRNGKNKNGSGGGDDGTGCDPAIQGLIQRLPPPDSDWPLDKQARWLLAVSHAFDVIYPREDDGRSLRIEIVKD